MSEMILDATQLPDPETMPIEDMDVSHPILLQQDKWQPYFKRLRNWTGNKKQSVRYDGL